MGKVNYLGLTIALITLSFIVFTAGVASASKTSFKRDYTYQASEADSKLTSRAIALEQVKRILLEEIGMFLISQTEIKNEKLTKDEVSTISAGVLETQIKEEKWDGETYYIKVEIVVDPKEVAKTVKKLVAEQNTLDDLKESKAKADAAMEELNKLRAELAEANARIKSIQTASAAPIIITPATSMKSKTKPKNKVKSNPKAKMPAQKKELISQAQQLAEIAIKKEEIAQKYQGAIDKVEASSLFKEGVRLFRAIKYTKAIEVFTEIIKLQPNNAKAYLYRGAANFKSRKGKNALADFNKTIELKPNMAKGYWGRGITLVKFYGKEASGRRDIVKAAKMGNRKAKRFMRKKYGVRY